jgi:hypothetical protein
LRHGPEVFPTIAGAEAGSADVARTATLSASVLSLYLSLLSSECLAEAQKRENSRVYNTAVVMWLMITQRLQAQGSMATAVLELPSLPDSLWPNPCKRRRPGKGPMSSNTGAYNNARQRLPVRAVEQFCDHVFEQLHACTKGSLPAIGRPAFVFDGTTVRTAHTEELRQLYPPTSNQEGESHWPLIKMLVAHDLATGLGMRPVWGAVNGPQAVSEQRLFEQALARLPLLAVVLGDSNFGVFSVAYASDQRKHPVVLRLTLARAKSLVQGPLTDGMDRVIDWRPTKADRRSHPELPPEACVRGRLIVSEVKPSDDSASFLLCLFTTLEEDKDEIIKLYGQRWNIETDLRSLKGTLRLEALTCNSPQMVDKEIEIAMVSYNLVRTVIYQAAQQAGIAPRRFSFTRVRNVINVYGPKIAAAKSEQEAKKLRALMSHYIAQAKLPQRERPTFSREVWHRSKPFPHKKARPREAQAQP